MQCACPALQCEWHTLTPIKINNLRKELVKRFAPATARRMLSALKGVLKECWRQGLLDAETLARLCDIAPVPGRSLSTGRALTLGELSVLRGLAAPRDRALLAVLAYGGLRRAEAASLTHVDIAQEGPLKPRTDHGSGPPPLHPSLALVRINVRHGKGDKERILYLAGQPAYDVAAYQRQLQHPLNDPFFGLSSGDAVWKAMNRLGKRANVSFTPHDLRRTFVSSSLAVGTDIATVAATVGHSDVRTTQKYDRRAEEAQRAAARRLTSTGPLEESESR